MQLIAIIANPVQNVWAVSMIVKLNSTSIVKFWTHEMSGEWLWPYKGMFDTYKTAFNTGVKSQFLFTI
jgi:hypothetical protein